MTTEELLPLLRSVANKGKDSPDIPAVRDWLAGQLQAIPVGDTWTTRQLFDSILEIVPEGGSVVKFSKLLTQALWRLRSCGAIDGLWGQDNRRRHMGHPLIVWHRPAEVVTVDRSIF